METDGSVFYNPTNPIQTVNDKTFLLQNGVWTDTIFQPDTMQTEKVVFLSDAYFELLEAHPELGDYFALGDLCAQQTFIARDARMVAGYAEKTLNAYRCAQHAATSENDRLAAEVAAVEFVDWLITVASQYASRRNIAVEFSTRGPS